MLSLAALVLEASSPVSGPAPIPRKGSPPIGSTLMTRAPRSASIDTPIGVAMMVANSRIVKPSSGRPLGFVPFADSAPLRAGQLNPFASPTVGAARSICAGVSRRCAIGPNCCTAPSCGSSIVTTSRLACISGLATASWVGVKISAATLPEARKMSIHSSAGRSCIRSRIRSRISSSASGVHSAGPPCHCSSANSSLRSAASMKA